MNPDECAELRRWATENAVRFQAIAHPLTPDNIRKPAETQLYFMRQIIRLLDNGKLAEQPEVITIKSS